VIFIYCLVQLCAEHFVCFFQVSSVSFCTFWILSHIYRLHLDLNFVGLIVRDQGAAACCSSLISQRLECLNLLFLIADSVFCEHHPQLNCRDCLLEI
jgi:hypothetical protein